VWVHLRELIVQPTGVDLLIEPYSTVVALVVFLFPLALDCTFTRDPRRWVMFLAAVLPFVVMPHYAFGVALLYQRFGVFVLLGWLLLWDRSPDKANLTKFVPLIIVALVAILNTFRFMAFDRETRHFTEIVDAIEPERRVAYVVLQPYSSYFHYPVYLHQAVWYQAEKNGIVDFNFANFFPQLVHFKKGLRPGIDDLFAWRPMDYSWDEYDGDRYDYFLFLAEEDLGPSFFREHAATTPLVRNSGTWWLYENQNRSAMD
jgi:hypothetical protein